jgi:hypothetical protein
LQNIVTLALSLAVAERAGYMGKEPQLVYVAPIMEIPLNLPITKKYPCHTLNTFFHKHNIPKVLITALQIILNILHIMKHKFFHSSFPFLFLSMATLQSLGNFLPSSIKQRIWIK